MTAGEYCNREVNIIEPDLSISEAAVLMRKYHVGMLVVVERREGITHPVGIITDRDLVIEVLAQEVPSDELLVKDIMSKDLVCVTEQETLLNTIALMQSMGVRRVVVLDNDNNLQGIVSADDALELIAEAMNKLCGVVRREMANEKNVHP
jgi:CBS domain-containing protein